MCVCVCIRLYQVLSLYLKNTPFRQPFLLPSDKNMNTEDTLLDHLS